MKAFLILALVACKGDKPAPPPPAPAPVPVPVVAADAAVPALPDTCKLGGAAIDHATCPTPAVHASLLAAKKSLDGLVQTVGQASADPQQFSVMCAQLLFAIERDAKKAGCTLALPDDKRAEIMAVLDTWYARRTPVTPTGDGAADAVVTKIAAVRDATCACKDGACLEQVGQQIAAIGAMPTTAPQAARDLGSKLLEDAARCAQRVRAADPAP